MFKSIINVKTHNREELVDITSKINEAVKISGITDGICVVFVPHTTASVTINENADPDVRKDIIAFLHKLIPKNANFDHFEGNSDAHIKSSMMGFSETVIIQNGQLILGTWQGIYFAEFDGPRNRKIHVSIIN